MQFLTDAMISGLLPAETSAFPSPVPTQIVSSDEFEPVPQTAHQREVEARLIALSDRLAQRQGLSRRRFFQSAAGMAASFVALNQVFGRLFDASEAEAATPEMADTRAAALSGQMVIDGHTHFLRDDTRLMGFVKAREAVGQWGWNKELGGKEQTVEELKFDNYIKEIYLDSDTKVALLSNSPSVVPEDWFLPQDLVFKTREAVNKQAGTRRMLAHFSITPGQPGWLDKVDEAIAGLRRLEIPDDMQRRHGFQPLGPADGSIKTAVFSGNSARLYGLEQHAERIAQDRLAALKSDYQKNGPGRSNLRYGYISKPE